ncbi:MAG TPA: DUF4239 domain-containing protein [Candidatus Binatia bacterium]|nr:DUF4239 domain-containing protein [Candidatus Binatia bacterium]
MSSWIWGFLFVGATVGLAIGGMLLVRRSVTLSTLESHNQVAGYIYNVVGVVYAVLLAFIAIVVWQQHTQVQSHVEQEANQLGDLYRNAQVFPEEVRARLQNQIRAYSRIVVEKEWPAMAKGETSLDAWAALNQLWRAYQQVEARNDHEKLWYAKSLDQLDQLGDFRRLRLVSNRAAVPALMWVVLLATGIITIGFSFFFGTPNSSAQALMTGALSATIGFVLFLIWDLNHPFAGFVRVEPTPFHQLWNIIDKWAQQ